MKHILIASLLFPLLTALCNANVIEQAIPARDVAPGAIILEWNADKPVTLSGFYIRLANCLPPRDEPIVAELIVRGKRIDERGGETGHDIQVTARGLNKLEE